MAKINYLEIRDCVKPLFELFIDQPKDLLLVMLLFKEHPEEFRDDPKEFILHPEIFLSTIFSFMDMVREYKRNPKKIEKPSIHYDEIKTEVSIILTKTLNMHSKWHLFQNALDLAVEDFNERDLVYYFYFDAKARGYDLSQPFVEKIIDNPNGLLEENMVNFINNCDSELKKYFIKSICEVLSIEYVDLDHKVTITEKIQKAMIHLDKKTFELSNKVSMIIGKLKYKITNHEKIPEIFIIRSSEENENTLLLESYEISNKKFYNPVLLGVAEEDFL